MRRLMLAALVVLSLSPATRAFGQCPQPNGNDTLPDADAIQCLLNQGGTVTLDADVSYGYFIDHTIYLWQNGTTLTGTSAYGNWALLQATPGLNQPMLWVSNGTAYYTLSNLWFYGDKFNRYQPNCSSDQSDNVSLRGGPFWVYNVESDAAPCNSGMTVDGTSGAGFEISNSWFAYNGFQANTPGKDRMWADGLTLWGCNRGYVHHNHFVDNTDVNLVVGGGSDCTVAYNTINNYSNHGFAGIHVGWFPGYYGNHSGVSYYGNTIGSSYNALAFGIVVGSHAWTLDLGVFVSNAGSVYGNASSGSVVNLAVDGIGAGSVVGNSIGSSQGNWGYGCGNSFGYGAGHIGAASVDGGYTHFIWDAGTCQYYP